MLRQVLLFRYPLPTLYLYLPLLLRNTTSDQRLAISSSSCQSWIGFFVWLHGYRINSPKLCKLIYIWNVSKTVDDSSKNECKDNHLWYVYIQKCIVTLNSAFDVYRMKSLIATASGSDHGLCPIYVSWQAALEVCWKWFGFATLPHLKKCKSV